MTSAPLYPWSYDVYVTTVVCVQAFAETKPHQITCPIILLHQISNLVIRAHAYTSKNIYPPTATMHGRSGGYSIQMAPNMQRSFCRWLAVNLSKSSSSHRPTHGDSGGWTKFNPPPPLPYEKSCYMIDPLNFLMCRHAGKYFKKKV